MRQPLVGPSRNQDQSPTAQKIHKTMISLQKIEQFLCKQNVQKGFLVLFDTMLMHLELSVNCKLLKCGIIKIKLTNNKMHCHGTLLEFGLGLTQPYKTGL